jgi:hypothetical protein
VAIVYSADAQTGRRREHLLLLREGPNESN